MLRLLLGLFFFCLSTRISVEGADREECLDQEVILLSNGVEMPKVGFGLAGMKGDETRSSLREHLYRGFRLMDGAESTEWYDDETAGDELEKLTEFRREDVFIVSKVHPTRLSYDDALQSVYEMLERWNHTEYLDLVLLHYPECGSWIPNCKERTGGDWMGAWMALEEHYNEGRIRALGVSNFDVTLLDELIDYSQNGVHVIQTWLDPFNQARNERQWAEEHGVAVTSYSSFGVQWEFNWVGKNLVFGSDVLAEIADEVNAPVTSVVLAWLLKNGIAVIPRSSNPEHIAENAKFLQPGYADSLLNDEQMDRIDELDGVFDAENAVECAKIVEEGRCGDDLADGWCRASCMGVQW